MNTDHSEMTESEGNIKRVNVNFSEDAYQALSEIAKAKSKSMADVLRDAIALEKWILETTERGDKFLIESAKDERLREVVFR